MDESVACKCLMETCRIADFRSFGALQLIIKWRMQDTSCDAEKALEFMISQWKAYQASRSRLQWQFAGAGGFFQSAIWQDESLWPWQRLVPRPDASVGVSKEPVESMSLEEINQFRRKNGMHPLESI